MSGSVWLEKMRVCGPEKEGLRCPAKLQGLKMQDVMEGLLHADDLFKVPLLGLGIFKKGLLRWIIHSGVQGLMLRFQVYRGILSNSLLRSEPNLFVILAVHMFIFLTSLSLYRDFVCTSCSHISVTFQVTSPLKFLP